MEFYETVNRRRSIRQFTDAPIAREVLERVLEAGLAAPSSDHQRRWELVVLAERDRIHELAQIVKPYPCRVKEPKSPQQEMFKIAFPRQRTMIEEAAAVVLPYFKCKYALDGPQGTYALNDFGAAWCVIENMLLAATAEGLGSVVHIPVKKEPEQIAALIQPKKDYQLPALVMLGHPAPDAEVPAQVEATVAKNVHWNEW